MCFNTLKTWMENGKNFFKIINPGQFEEIRVVGNTMVVRLIEAKLFPEKNLIRDLVMHYDEFAVDITEREYESMKS